MKLLMKLFYEKTNRRDEFQWTDITENIFEALPTEKDLKLLEDIIVNIAIYISAFDNISKLAMYDDYEDDKDLKEILLDEIGLRRLNPLFDRVLAYSVIILLNTQKDLSDIQSNADVLAKNLDLVVESIRSVASSKLEHNDKSENKNNLVNMIDVSALEIGATIKNYKELCKMLNQETKTGHSKELQLEDFRRYFEYERSGQKFIITDIYDMPLTKEDKRRLGNNSIYVKSIELILLQYLSKQKGYTKTFTKRNWWEMLGMVNKKYNKVAPKQLETIDYTVTSFQIKHFYQRCNKKLEQILFSALNNLKNRKLIIWELQTVIVYYDENSKSRKSFLADDEDKKRILQIERYILKNVMGYEKIIQVYCRFKQNEYYQLVNDKLNELYGWDYYFKQIKLIYTPEDVLDAMQQSEIDLQKEILNEKIIRALNENAQEKYEVEKKKWDDVSRNLIWGECDKVDSKSGLWKIPDTYLEAQRILTDELINIGHKENRFVMEQFEEDDEMNQIFTSFMC